MKFIKKGEKMKGSLKRRLSIALMFVLLLSSFVTPVGAEFHFSKDGQSAVPNKQKAELPIADSAEDIGDHPLYGQDGTSLDLNEKVRLIVEVDVNEKAKSMPEKQVEQVKNSFMKKRDSSSKVIHTYSTGFYGFSMETTMKEAHKIKEADGVKDIRIAKTYEHMDVKSNELVEAMNVWSKYNYSGDGMVVAIVDSGIDYEHEALKLSEKGKKKAKYNEENIQAKLNETEVNDIWYTDKVPTGYDWADKDTNVIPASSSHGTHVAGIVGAYEESQKKAIGVAPDVQLLAEKVFSDNNGGAYDDDIVAGIYHAVEFGADVINLSLGSDAGVVDPNDPVQRAIQYATEQGVLVVAAAGNASYSTKQNILERSQLPLAKNPDIGLVGDPGITPSALQVASSENDQMKVDTLRLSDGSLLGYQISPYAKKLIGTLDADKEYELIFAGEGFGKHLEGLDLEGKMVIAKPARYSTYSTLQHDLKKKGAAALIVIPPSDFTPYSTLIFSANSIPAVTTDQETSIQLVERLKSGEKVTAQLSDEGLWVQNPETEPMSYFSSYGSPTDLSFKPEITAPGGKISSTVLNNQIETMSGTSMAAPHVAAGGALLLQKYYEELQLPKNKATVLKAKNALMNTSKILTNPENDNTPYSPRRQGSGLMKIEQAVKTPYLLQHSGAPLEKSSSVALKEVDRTFDFTLDVEPIAKNLEKANHQYEIVVDVLMDETEEKTYGGVERNYLTLNSVPIEDAVVKINGKQVTDKSRFQYKPRRDDEVNISVTLPEELSDGRFVEGFVRFVPKGSSVKDLTTLTMPFMGFYGDWDSLDNIDESPVNGDPYLAYTVLWNDMFELPLGYDQQTGKFDQNAVGYSPRSIASGIHPSFTAFRNLKEMSLSVQDEEGNTVSNITDFSEYTEGGSPYTFRKNIMSYRDFYYKFDGIVWSGKDDEGNLLPDGNYYYVYESTLNYDGAEPQQTKIPISLDSVSPVVENIKITNQPDGKYKITWDVIEEGSGYIGSFVWVNGKRKSVADGSTEVISDEKPEIVMVSAMDNFRNAGVGYTGNEDLLHADPFINYFYVSGTNINENKPASILIFGYKRMDWHIEISDAEGNVIEYADIENEHSIYGLKWYPGAEYPDGDYYVTVTGTDETGLSLTSDPKKITVKH
ncbi:S8 family serine peptidase [Rossellomorea yichunensis]|uniref:S8 family serine peptidase n=1 Tax=Rossellomorea yichunensis TaxID=3077331 RepID=UPI0028DFC0A8|nr:S8 family serine peptidase [Rossellomorea sp. YC4-1]MDT9026326.1 S8 family serine peptidase [Rossellomorea sp. YC4-1]